MLVEIEDDCQDIIMSGSVAPQVKSFLAGVEDVAQKLVLVHCDCHVAVISALVVLSKVKRIHAGRRATLLVARNQEKGLIIM